MTERKFETTPVVFGIPEEWDRFARANVRLLEGLPNLIRAGEIAFSSRQFKVRSADMAIYSLGSLCQQDFWDILLLCGNGCGMSAQKVVRGMYERAVTANYLHLNPQEADLFFDFHAVTKYRLGKSIIDIFGAEALPVADVDRAREHYEAVKAEFQMADCKKCGTTRTNHTWNKVDFVSMAKSCETLRKFLVQAYYLPLQQSHPSFFALNEGLRETADGDVELDYTEQIMHESLALGAAHGILIAVLDLQKQHFQIDELESPLQTCQQDYEESMKDSPPHQ
jgi:hypothetical protein